MSKIVMQGSNSFEELVDYYFAVSNIYFTFCNYFDFYINGANYISRMITS